MFTDCSRSGDPTTIDQSETVSIIVTASTLGLLLLLITIIVCIFKQRKTRNRAANVIKTDENATYGDYSDPDPEVTCDDENPTYGDYFDPDPRAEVEDTNDYYSSDYEAGTGLSRATDNNPYYE